MNLSKIGEIISKFSFHKRSSFYSQSRKYALEHKEIIGIASLGIILIIIVLFTTYKSSNTSNQASYFRMRSEYYIEPFQVIRGLENAILVDVRPKDRYDEEHIIDALHLEVVTDPNTGKVQNKNAIEQELKKIASHGEEVIIYGENIYSNVPNEVATIAAENGIHVKLLAVGWNEFRHFSAFWVPEKIASKINILDYLEGQGTK